MITTKTPLYVILEVFFVAFNDSPGQWLTRSRLVVIPIIRAELSTVCELKPRRWQGHTRRPCKGHMCSRWQVYLFWVRGSPTALTTTKRSGKMLKSHVPDWGPPASERCTCWGMCGIQLNMSVWGLGHRSHELWMKIPWFEMMSVFCVVSCDCHLFQSGRQSDQENGSQWADWQVESQSPMVMRDNRCQMLLLNVD